MSRKKSKRRSSSTDWLQAVAMVGDGEGRVCGDDPDPISVAGQVSSPPRKSWTRASKNSGLRISVVIRMAIAAAAVAGLAGRLAVVGGEGLCLHGLSFRYFTGLGYMEEKKHAKIVRLPAHVSRLHGWILSGDVCRWVHMRTSQITALLISPLLYLLQQRTGLTFVAPPSLSISRKRNVQICHFSSKRLESRRDKKTDLTVRSTYSILKVLVLLCHTRQDRSVQPRQRHGSQTKIPIRARGLATLKTAARPLPPPSPRRQAPPPPPRRPQHREQQPFLRKTLLAASPPGTTFPPVGAGALTCYQETLPRAPAEVPSRAAEACARGPPRRYQ